MDGTVFLGTCPHQLEVTLIDILVGKKPIKANEIAELLEHFVTCADCQLAFEALFTFIRGSEYIERESADMALLIETIHQMFIEVNLNANMAAFLDELVQAGSASAGQKYPLLAHHITHCDECRLAIEIGLELLDDAGNEEGIVVIDPWESSTGHPLLTRIREHIQERITYGAKDEDIDKEEPVMAPQIPTTTCVCSASLEYSGEVTTTILQVKIRGEMQAGISATN